MENAPQGGTALYDAISLASEELMRKQHGRKALIVLSDGCDTANKLSLGKAIDDALRSDTLIYSIRRADKSAKVPVRWRAGEIPSPEEGREVLQQMSADTGGSAIRGEALTHSHLRPDRTGTAESVQPGLHA